MKKILLILIPLLFLVTGCWDYKELNDMAIVVGAGIDYTDEDFTLTLEILSDQKDTDTKSYLIDAKGSTYLETLTILSRKCSKILDFTHLQVIVIGENIAYESFESFVDYELRNAKLSNMYNLVVAKEISANEIFKAKSESVTMAETIIKSLKNDVINSNIALDYNFEELLDKALSFGTEMALSSIKINDGNLVLDSIAVFKDFNLKGYLKEEESVTFNLLQKKDSNALYKYNCGEKESVLATISATKIDILVNQNKILIDLKALGNISTNNCSYDITNESLAYELEKQIETNIKNLIYKTRSLDSDIIGITKKYYLNTGVKDENVWQKINIDINVDLSIVQKGLAYEVKHNDN